MMTREEAMEYRQNCPYDAMGDFSVFEDGTKEPSRKEGGDDEENMPPVRSPI